MAARAVVRELADADSATSGPSHRRVIHSLDVAANSEDRPDGGPDARTS